MIHTTGLAIHGHHLVISRRFNTNNGSVVYVRLAIMVFQILAALDDS
jgi:hypothetical protein